MCKRNNKCVLLKWNTMTVNECLRIKKLFSWDYKWWLQHIHPSSWAFTHHPEHNRHVVQEKWKTKSANEKRKWLGVKSLFSLHHDAIFESETMEEAVPVGTSFQNPFPLPHELRPVLGAVSHSFTESEIVYASPTGSTPSWDPSILCLRHGSKPLKNSAYKTGSNARTECYFKTHPN